MQTLFSISVSVVQIPITVAGRLFLHLPSFCGVVLVVEVTPGVIRSSSPTPRATTTSSNYKLLIALSRSGWSYDHCWRPAKAAFPLLFDVLSLSEEERGEGDAGGTDHGPEVQQGTTKGYEGLGELVVVLYSKFDFIENGNSCVMEDNLIALSPYQSFFDSVQRYFRGPKLFKTVMIP